MCVLLRVVMVAQTLKDVVKQLAGFGQTFEMYFKRYARFGAPRPNFGIDGVTLGLTG